MSLYDFMYWISTLQLYGNRLNILGLIWLSSLVTFTYFQIRKPISDLRAEKGWKHLGTFRMLLLALIPVILTHFISDETYTFMVIGFGHFNTYMGSPLTIQMLWATKFDVYLAILALSLLFIQLDIYTRFHRRWFFLAFAGAWFSLHLYAALASVGDFSQFQGWERFWRFWLYYPSSKVLLAFCYISLLKRTTGPMTRASITRGISISGIRITIALCLSTIRAIRYKPRTASLFRALNPFTCPMFPELIRKTLSHFGIHLYKLHSSSPVKIDSYLFIDGKPVVFDWNDRAEVIVAIKEIMRDQYYGPPHHGLTVDVGANVGIYSLFSAKTSRVIAIEPLERTWEILRLNSRSENILPLKLAIGREAGYRKLFLSEVTAACSLRAQGLSSSYVWVQTKRLDGVFQELGIKEVDTLKIDCEGAEMEILESAGLFLKERKIKHLIIASYHYPAEVEEVTDLLHACGYRTAIQRSSEVMVFGLREN